VNPNAGSPTIYRATFIYPNGTRLQDGTSTETSSDHPPATAVATNITCPGAPGALIAAYGWGLAGTAYSNYVPGRSMFWALGPFCCSDGSAIPTVVGYLNTGYYWSGAAALSTSTCAQFAPGNAYATASPTLAPTPTPTPTLVHTPSQTPAPQRNGGDDDGASQDDPGTNDDDTLPILSPSLSPSPSPSPSPSRSRS
jgi:hypothetical protein